MGSDQDWREFRSLSRPAWIFRRQDIAIGLAPGSDELAVGGPAGLGKLRGQIMRRPSKRARARLRMTLAHEGFKMADDSNVLVGHNKRLTG